MTVLGQYDFRNTIFLNPNIDSSETLSTVVHEQAHMLLSQTTVWGVTLVCLRKLEQLSQLNLISRDTYCVLNDFLCSHIKVVQEAIAVYVEFVFCIKCNGWEEAINFLDKLRIENAEYYRYINHFKTIIDIMRRDRVNGNQLDQITNLVFGIGKKSLNSPLFEIGADVFRSKKN